MNQRRITEAEVERVIKQPDFSFKSRLGRNVSVKKYNEKLLKVVYEKENDKITVITVYWTRRLRRG